MPEANYTHVMLVVDPDFGERAKAHAGLYPLWVIQSPKNVAAIKALWDSGPSPFESAPTYFYAVEGRTPEDAAAIEIDVVDQHHRAWRTFEVIGTRLSEKLLAAMRECAPGSAVETPEGFIFTRAN